MYIFYDWLLSLDFCAWLLSVDFCSGIISVVFYANGGDLEKVIKKENRGKSGIYRWKNLITGESYIGSSVQLSKRFSQYFSFEFINRCRGFSRIHRALLKYGYANFSVEILEYCEPDKLLEREKYYFELLQPEYNICSEPGSPMLGRKHSEESRAKMSAVALGRQISEEHKEKISLSMPNRIKIEVLDLETNINTSYDSMGAAARALNISISCINKDFKRNQKKPYKGRYIFKKID